MGLNKVIRGEKGGLRREEGEGTQKGSVSGRSQTLGGGGENKRHGGGEK